MDTQMMDSTIMGCSIGEDALEWLTSGQDAKVVASVSQAIYLSVGKEEIYWIAEDNSSMHRRCLQISSPIPKLVVGSILHIRDRMLEMPSWGLLDFSHSLIWKAPALLAEKIIAPEKFAELCMLFYRQFLHGHQPVGLGCLMPAILSRLDHESPHPDRDPGNIFLTVAWPVIERIISILLAHDYSSFPDVAVDLVGLGEGLTPSGDDFLGGLLFGLHLVRNAYPEALASPWNYSAFIEQCESRTNRISFTLLKDHAIGHTLEPLHKFADALLQGQTADHMLPFAEELIHVGHSTGWDLLTSFMVGTTVVFPR